jgi:hypothetical protein
MRLVEWVWVVDNGGGAYFVEFVNLSRLVSTAKKVLSDILFLPNTFEF